MSDQHRLEIDIRSYWHPGTGKGSGSHVDAVVERDRFGCPFVSGKMIKGLLRDAVNRLSQWGHFQSADDSPTAECIVECLFGSPSTSESTDDTTGRLKRHSTMPGMLQVSDAVLDKALRRWLGQPAQIDVRNALFTDVYSTAIDADNGIARQRSLRGKQVVVPVVLNADISISAASLVPEEKRLDYELVQSEAVEIIKHSLPFIRAVGANRTRGFGRAQMKLVKREA